MFSFFQKRATPDLSFIGVDMHSHLLPGLDDGLTDIETTISFVEQLQELGYKKLICTPHIISDLYPNSPSTILPRLGLVREALSEKNMGVPIEAAAEYMMDEVMESNVDANSQLLTFGKNFILVEMSYLALSPYMEKIVFMLKTRGMQPILAHPERYGFYHNTFESYERLIDLGCLLQVNILSLAGYYGKPIKAVAEKLMAKKMISFVGTDVHHINHLEALKELATRKEFYKLFSNIEIRNLELL